MDTIAIEDSLGIQFTKRLPLVAASAAGNRVWDAAGQEYLDFTSGWGVTSLGHCHPALTTALSEQAAVLTQNPNSGFSYSPVRAALLQKLAPLLPEPLTRLYFVNSGAEANDLAIKMARLLTGRIGIVATERSFHGRTQNTLTVSTSQQAADRFPPRMPATSFVPHGDLDAMAKVITSATAAVIVEPIQGEGGVRIPDSAYLAAVSQLCKQYGALLIVDEVQTGICRTGSMFAVEQSHPAVQPDMLTMGKGLGGGFPIAALAMSEACAQRVTPGDHGGTYCGNPLACAAALAVVSELVDKDVAGQAARTGKSLLAGLSELAAEFPELIAEVRGRGLLCAIELANEDHVEPFTHACLRERLLVTPTRNGIIRLLPSLLVSPSEVSEALGKLRSALASVRASEIAIDCHAHVQA